MSFHLQPISHLSAIELESFSHTNTTTDNPSCHHNDDVHLAAPISHPAAIPAPSSNAAKARTIIIITCVAVVTGLTSFLAGVLVVATPAIAKDLQLNAGMVLW